MISKFTVESVNFLIANNIDALIITIIDHSTKCIYSNKFSSPNRDKLYTLLCNGFNGEDQVTIELELHQYVFGIHIIHGQEIDETLVFPFVGQMDSSIDVQLKQMVTDAVDTAINERVT